MKIKNSHAIVLHSLAYGEADKIVTFLTKDFGKIKGFAKGARRSQKRFGSSLDLGALVSLQFKPAKGELFFIEGALTLLPNPAWRKKWETIVFVTIALEWINSFVPERIEAPEKFELLTKFLKQIDESRGLSQLVAFEQEIIIRAGFGVDWHSCAACKEQTEMSQWRFDPSQGGLLCVKCHRGRGKSVDGDKIESEDPQVLQALLEDFFAATIGRRLKSSTIFTAL